MIDLTFPSMASMHFIETSIESRYMGDALMVTGNISGMRCKVVFIGQSHTND